MNGRTESKSDCQPKIRKRPRSAHPERYHHHIREAFANQKRNLELSRLRLKNSVSKQREILQNRLHAKVHLMNLPPSKYLDHIQNAYKIARQTANTPTYAAHHKAYKQRLRQKKASPRRPLCIARDVSSLSRDARNWSAYSKNAAQCARLPDALGSSAQGSDR